MKRKHGLLISIITVLTILFVGMGIAVENDGKPCRSESLQEAEADDLLIRTYAVYGSGDPGSIPLPKEAWVERGCIGKGLGREIYDSYEMSLNYSGIVEGEVRRMFMDSVGLVIGEGRIVNAMTGAVLHHTLDSGDAGDSLIVRVYRRLPGRLAGVDTTHLIDSWLLVAVK